jgi:CDP-glucose 4,6-dehydratase
MINDLRKFWRNKKVFVTGHTGFKGTWLIIFLNLLKAKTYGYSLKAPKNSIFNQTKSFNLVKKKLLL